MTPATVIALDGVVQPISEHALDYGIPASLIIARLRGGWDTREAIETPMVAAPGQKLAADTKVRGKRRASRTRMLTHAGETLTVKEWSKRTGINIHTINARLRKGLTIAEALSPLCVRKGPEGALYTYGGKTMCVRAWERHTGIAVGTLNHRLRKGKSIGEAINAPINARFRPKGYAPSVGRPGVGQNSAESQGTGGRSFARESAKLEFSE